MSRGRGEGNNHRPPSFLATLVGGRISREEEYGMHFGSVSDEHRLALFEAADQKSPHGA